MTIDRVFPYIVIPHIIRYICFFLFFTFTISHWDVSDKSDTDIAFLYDRKIPFAIWIVCILGHRIIFVRPRLPSSAVSARVATRKCRTHSDVFILTRPLRGNNLLHVKHLSTFLISSSLHAVRLLRRLFHRGRPIFLPFDVTFVRTMQYNLAVTIPLSVWRFLSMKQSVALLHND
jgi:hypothetical protein